MNACRVLRVDLTVVGQTVAVIAIVAILRHPVSREYFSTTITIRINRRVLGDSTAVAWLLRIPAQAAGARTTRRWRAALAAKVVGCRR